MGYKNNFWDQAYYRTDTDAPAEEFWWMPMDPTGPKPMHRMNESTRREDEKRAHDAIMDVVFDYAW